MAFLPVRQLVKYVVPIAAISIPQEVCFVEKAKCDTGTTTTGKDNQERTTRKGQPGQDSQDGTAKTIGQSGKNEDRTARMRLPGKDSKNKIAGQACQD